MGGRAESQGENEGTIIVLEGKMYCVYQNCKLDLVHTCNPSIW